MKTIKLLLIQLTLIIACILFGWLVLSISFSLPQDKIQENIHRSAKFFDQNYVYLTGDNAGRLDLWTDGRMLLTAGARENKHAYLAALESLSNYSTGGPAVFLHKYYGSNEYKNSEDAKKFSYGRYWHGYLVFLQPLLLFTDYGHIRNLNIIFHFFLVGTVFLFLLKQKQVYLTVALFLAWLMLNPISVCLCLQYTAVTNLTFIAILGILLFNKKLCEHKLVLASYFTVLGALANFFDFLSFPLISLGIPLIFHIYLQHGVQVRDYKPFTAVIILSFCWALGYSGMWVGKWILTDLLTNVDIVSQVFGAITNRGGTTIHGQTINFFDLLGREFFSLSAFWRLLFIVAWGFSLISLFIPRIARHFSWQTLIVYFFVSAFPFMWSFFMQNHSYEHAWFVFRILCVNLMVAVIIPIHLILFKTEIQKRSAIDGA